jgi:hypothetical protein
MNEPEPAPVPCRVSSFAELRLLETLEIDGKKAELSSDALTILARHHIGIQEKATGLLLTFPEGTTMQEIWPRTACERHRIVLADG